MNEIDLYCSIYAHCDLEFRDFVSLIARCLNADANMNSISSESLDIAIYENDAFEAERSRTAYGHY